MGYPEPIILAVLAKYPNRPIWPNLGVPLNAKIIGLNYRGSQSWLKDSNRTIKSEAVNILGPWFTNHEIEACL